MRERGGEPLPPVPRHPRRPAHERVHGQRGRQPGEPQQHHPHVRLAQRPALHDRVDRQAARVDPSATPQAKPAVEDDQHDQGGQQHALHEMHARGIIRESGRIDRERQGRVGAAMHGAGHRLRQHVLAPFMRIGTGEPEAGADRIDQPRIDALEVVVAEPHPLHDAGAEIVHHHVRGLHQLVDDRLAALAAHVERQRALVAVEAGEDRIVRPVGIVERHGREGGPQDRLRPLLGRQTLDQGDDVGLERHAGAEVALQLLELRPRRQLAVPEQVDDLLEGRALRQVVDIVAAVDQDAFQAIDGADRG